MWRWLLTLAVAAPLMMVLQACQGNRGCPPGTTAMGAAPPQGDETWCQKIVDGKPIKDGPFSLYRPAGTLMLQGDYLNGKQNGQWKMWYDSGAIHTVDTYKNGVQDGPHTSWYPNGHLDAKGQYKNGQKSGVWKRWSSNGYSNWQEVYNDGKKVSGPPLSAPNTN